MRLTPVFALASLAICGLDARGVEQNLWPFYASEKDAAGNVTEWQAGGPLVFGKEQADGRAGGVRPFYVWKEKRAGGRTQSSLLYPLLTYRTDASGSSWNVFSIIRSSTPKPGVSDRYHSLDFWPFYFSRRTGDPAASYRALFPVAGAVKNRFGQDKWSWVFFPLYGRFEKNNVVTTTAPWPFVKVMRGQDNHGVELWPLFGYRYKDGAYREQYYIWPLIYKQEHALWAPQPEVKLGVLPFYTRDQSAHSISESYLWPFFGYTDRTAPDRYHETRYFWPFLVQGRGDRHTVNRWGPFYTHSVFKGRDKTWVAWPLWRQIRWDDSGLEQTKTTVLYFLYGSLTQQSLAHAEHPPARRTTLWPLFTMWDNGAGRRQVEVLSPLESFFPSNETVRLAYSPLFAIYRYDRRAPDSVRQDFLFNFVSWQRSPNRKEFHLGPLFKMEKSPGTASVSLLDGLIGLRHGPAGRGWRPFAFDFSPKTPTSELTSR
ncbi:MAG: hypothetical protein KGJ37_02985 [Verrucomicrobiota bacterium]|nr:hypothetical protein [Verrucomicrobiota bacterium]